MKGITLAQVSAAAQALVLEGSPVTIRRVRDHLGTGSMSTISQLLKTWREQMEIPEAKATVPSSLHSALISALTQAANDARIQEEKASAELKEDNVLLSESIVQREAEIDELRKELEDTVRQRERTIGKADLLEAELANYIARLQDALAAAEFDRTELAKEAQLHHDFRKQCEAHGEEMLRTQAELRSERQGRIAAEKEAAVLKAKLESQVEQLLKAEEWASPDSPDTFNNMMCSGDINDEDKKELHGRVQA